MNMSPDMALFQPTIWRREYKVEVFSDLAAVEKVWAELEPRGTAFQTRAWLKPWFRIVGSQYGATPLFVIVSERGDPRPLMVLPLCRRRRHGLTLVEFPDLDVSDYNAPLVAAGFEPSADEVARLWDQIARALAPADVVRFDKMPAVVNGAANPLVRLSFVGELAERAWLLTLPTTLQAYAKEKITHKTQKEHRRKLKNLSEQTGEVRIVFAEDAATGERMFAALRAQRLARFGVANLLEQPCFGDFYRAVIFEPWGPLALMSALQAGDKILAAQFALRHGDNYLLIMHAFEPELCPLSAGIVAIRQLIDNRIAAGFRGFDFTVGNEGYKRDFGVEAQALYGGVSPLSTLGRLYAFALPWAKKGRAKLRRLYHAARARLPMRSR